mmetsp:Transcript_57310/g.153170  ORF Transcript_57310/g.153170 Transcript_57310/m.153170 type:complete len:217 (+) Transcript_57310:143-793(+)
MLRVLFLFLVTVHASVTGWTGARVSTWVPAKKPVQQSWTPDSLRRIGIEDRTVGMFCLLATLLGAAALLHSDFKDVAIATKSGCAASDLDAVQHGNEFGLTPLHFAAYSGSVETIDALLGKGSGVHLDVWDQSPLHCAASKGHGAALQVLVDHMVSLGLSLDQQDASGNTALVLAGRAGNAAAVDVLLRAGASASVQEEELPPLVTRQLVIHLLEA